ncbi:MAG TPA: hypothetical protein VKD91_22685 [Pyrinomonadaceae bacterium]|nr:hypothetical protein [Pyrinomonadaceae bacterium]
MRGAKRWPLIAYTVARQTHEIGIWLALGAAPANVVSMVLRRGLQLIGVGVAAGWLGLAVTRVRTNQCRHSEVFMER